MPQSIPLIRAAAIAPMRRWVIQSGHSPEPFLRKAGLAWVPQDDPFLPLPLRGVVQFLVEISRALGPDTPYRMVKGRGGYEIGYIGAAAFCGPTVREGFRRISRSMPVHCTHEVFTVVDEADGLHVRDGWSYVIGDDETLHFVQQYVAALVDMIGSVALGRSPSADRVELIPHPSEGLVHLRPWFGDKVKPANDRALVVVLGNEVAAKLFPEAVQRNALSQFPVDVARLRRGKRLSDDVATLMASMLPLTVPNVDEVAEAASVSGRTLRRLLKEEDESFSSILERTRAQIAVERLQLEPATPIGDIATELGYSDPATLTRLVKRWIGYTPNQLRKVAPVRDFNDNQRILLGSKWRNDDPDPER